MARMEAQKRATVEHDRKLEFEYKSQLQSKMLAEQAKIDRENHDVKMEQLKLEAEQSRMTTIESLKEKRQTMIATLT